MNDRSRVYVKALLRIEFAVSAKGDKNRAIIIDLFINRSDISGNINTSVTAPFSDERVVF